MHPWNVPLHPPNGCMTLHLSFQTTQFFSRRHPQLDLDIAAASFPMVATKVRPEGSALPVKK